MKRVLYLLGVIAAVAAIIGIGYFFRYRSEPAAPEGQPAAGGGLPAAQAPQIPIASAPSSGSAALPQKFGVVTTNPVRDYFVDSQNNLLLVQPDGQVVKITNGKAGSLSSTPIQDLFAASFSYNGRKLIVSFGSRSAPQTSVFDVSGKTWRPLQGDIRNPVWAPGDERIAYFSSTGDALTTLNLGDEKAKSQTALKLRVGDVTLVWPATEKILLGDAPSAFFRGSVWGFNFKTRTLAAVVSDQLGATVLSNPKADRILVFASNRSNRGGNLKITDGDGAVLETLAPLTIPSKCVFYEEVISPPTATSTPGATTTTKASVQKSRIVESLVCAIPRDRQAFASGPLPDNYDKRALFTEDNIYKIDLTTGVITTIFDNQAFSIDAENLKVFNKRLFFVNRYDEKLYAASLE